MKLGYLVFTSPNPHSCEVLLEAPKGVTVDLEKRIWQYAHAIYPQQEEEIGQSRYIGWGKQPGAPIGVFDLDDFEHLNNMVRAAVEAHADHSNAD